MKTFQVALSHGKGMQTFNIVAYNAKDALKRAYYAMNNNYASLTTNSITLTQL